MHMPSIFWGIDTEASYAVSTGCTKYENTHFERTTTDIYTVRLVFDKIPLLRGKYWLNLILTCENVIHIYDNVSHYIMLNVEQEEIVRGVVAISHQWIQEQQS